jgi:hypothetical protein
MDSELRRRFLQLLSGDLARIDLRNAGVRCPSGGRWDVTGPQNWPRIRTWWLDQNNSDA